MASHIGREESASVVASSARVAVGLHLSQRADVSGDCTVSSEGTCGEEEMRNEGLSYSDPDSSTQHPVGPLRRSSCPLCGAIDADAIGSGSPYRTGAWCLPLGIREEAIQQEDIRSVGSWIAEPEGRKTGN